MTNHRANRRMAVVILMFLAFGFWCAVFLAQSAILEAFGVHRSGTVALVLCMMEAAGFMVILSRLLKG